MVKELQSLPGPPISSDGPNCDPTLWYVEVEGKAFQVTTCMVILGKDRAVRPTNVHYWNGSEWVDSFHFNITSDPTMDGVLAEAYEKASEAHYKRAAILLDERKWVLRR